MTLQEVREKKAEIEKTIFKLLTDFHGETGIKIDGISIKSTVVSCGEVIIGVKLIIAEI
jgi:hypothetical protein